MFTARYELVPGSDELPFAAHDAHRGAAGVDVGEALGDVHGREGDDEGGDGGFRHDKPVENAHNRPGANPQKDRDRDRQIVARHASGGDAAGQRDNRADRQVDAAQDNHHRHAACEVEVCGELPQHVPEIPRGAEGLLRMRVQRQEKAQDDERHDDPEIDFDK